MTIQPAAVEIFGSKTTTVNLTLPHEDQSGPLLTANTTHSDKYNDTVRGHRFKSYVFVTNCCVLPLYLHCPSPEGCFSNMNVAQQFHKHSYDFILCSAETSSLLCFGLSQSRCQRMSKDRQELLLSANLFSTTLSGLSPAN